MMRLNVFLLIALLASAMYLVHVQYQSRRMFTELERVNAIGQKLETEQSRLQVERRAEATSLRVENLARERLSMRVAAPAITQYVKADGTPLAVLPEPPQVAPAKPPVRGRRP
ncbi:MAG: cell division protein FtsL [Burkholderiales bacterium]